MYNRSFIVILLSLLLATSASAGGKQLTFSHSENKDPFHAAAAEIIRQAYANLGINVVFKIFPSERALQMSNNGHSDGELVRIEGIGAKYPNLIRIPVSYVTAEQMAFARDPSIKIDGWNSLKPYRIVFHRGYKVAEKNTIGMDRYLIGTAEKGFVMVEKGRKDVAIANRFTGEGILKNQEFKNMVMLTPPVQRDPLFHYIHSRHRDLVDDITGILKMMESRGEFAKILKQFGVTSLNQ